MLTKGVLIACLDQIGLAKLWEDLIQVNPINEALCRVNFRFKGWSYSGADLGEGCRGCAPPPRDDLRFSNTTGILQKMKNYVVYWC